MISVVFDAYGRATPPTSPTLSVAEMRAFYEGARGSEFRSTLATIVQEARKDLPRHTRRELIRISRHLWKNNPLVKAVVERLVTYTVGTGIVPEPSSSDEAWNRRATAIFKQWTKRPDISSRLSLAKLQAISLRSTLVDGDVFINKTIGDSGRPRIQLIEAHEVGSPAGSPSANPLDDDGVITDRRGRPDCYVFWAYDDNNQKVATPVDADDVVHLANIERPGQCRGVTLAASALATACDLHDILNLEKIAVKDASSKLDIIQTASGEIENDGGNIIGRSATSPAGNDAETLRHYRQVFGPESLVLRSGDKFTPYIPQRPSPAWTGFVDFLAEMICLSFNLPPSVVRQMKVGGADTRRDLSTVQRVVEEWQAVLIQQWQLIYEYVIEEEIRSGALAGAPSDWRECEWQCPRAVTVDAGRQAQQDREDVRTGGMTQREYCGQFGQPWRPHFRQLAIETRVVLDLETEFNLPPGALYNRLYAQNAQSPFPAPFAVDGDGGGDADSADDNVDDPKKQKRTK